MRRPTVTEVLPLVRAYLERHPGGGALHIFIEDGNVKDGHMLGCYDGAMHGPDFQAWLAYMEEQFPDARTTRDARAELEAGKHDYEGAALALLLLAMTQTQRRKIYRTA